MEKISTFLSVGKPHNNMQQNYVDNLVKYLDNKNIIAETLGTTFYPNKSPLIPIQEKMQEVNGAIILAMERFHSKEGIYREGSDEQEKFEDQYFATVWTQIEGAMAYQLGLPLLILKEKKLIAEGMFDPEIHEWKVTNIDSSNPEELFKNPIKSQIDVWIQDVQKYHKSKQKSNNYSQNGPVMIK
jgi:hypothetical protein